MTAKQNFKGKLDIGSQWHGEVRRGGVLGEQEQVQRPFLENVTFKNYSIH